MTEQQQLRTVAHRLAVLRHAEEVSRSVSKTACYYGIARKTFYVWERRYVAYGEARATRPQLAAAPQPTTTAEDIVGKIIYLRQTYHFGPLKIAMYLKRYHDISLSSGVWRILRRVGLPRLLASQRYRRYRERWKRYEKPQPGHQVQIDVKFIAPLKGARKTYYQFTAIDDCTRLRVLRLYRELGQKTAIQFVDYVLEKLPFQVQHIQTDNGSEFQARFHWHVLDRGIDHMYIRPATPRLNGKVERSHRIDAEEFYRMLDGVVIDDAGLFNRKLQEWEDFYNYDRPDGSLGGHTPYERLRQRVSSCVTRLRQLHS